MKYLIAAIAIASVVPFCLALARDLSFYRSIRNPHLIATLVFAGCCAFVALSLPWVN